MIQNARGAGSIWHTPVGSLLVGASAALGSVPTCRPAPLAPPSDRAWVGKVGNRSPRFISPRSAHREGRGADAQVDVINLQSQSIPAAHVCGPGNCFARSVQPGRDQNARKGRQAGGAPAFRGRVMASSRAALLPALSTALGAAPAPPPSPESSVRRRRCRRNQAIESRD